MTASTTFVSRSLGSDGGPDHAVVDRAAWLAARTALLAREKDLTRLRDEVAAARRALPWVKVEKDYVFDTPSGRRSLADLFDGRSQLVVYHFMFTPGWDAGCVGCSLMADHFDGTLAHLNNHDVTLAAVSRAPLADIEAYRRRMGWRFPWASSHGSDFNFDFQVSFTPEELASGKIHYNFEDTDATGMPEDLPGLSAFYRGEDGAVFHTYSAYTRGLDELIGAFAVLDRAPKGRNETTPMDFVRRHDEYEAAPRAACCHDAA